MAGYSSDSPEASMPFRGLFTNPPGGTAAEEGCTGASLIFFLPRAMMLLQSFHNHGERGPKISMSTAESHVSGHTADAANEKASLGKKASAEEKASLGKKASAEEKASAEKKPFLKKRTSLPRPVPVRQPVRQQPLGRSPEFLLSVPQSPVLGDHREHTLL